MSQMLQIHSSFFDANLDFNTDALSTIREYTGLWMLDPTDANLCVGRMSSLPDFGKFELSYRPATLL